jgi:hypothetical protein
MASGAFRRLLDCRRIHKYAISLDENRKTRTSQDKFRDKFYDQFKEQKLQRGNRDAIQ